MSISVGRTFPANVNQQTQPTRTIFDALSDNLRTENRPINDKFPTSIFG